MKRSGSETLSKSKQKRLKNQKIESQEPRFKRQKEVEILSQESNSQQNDTNSQQIDNGPQILPRQIPVSEFVSEREFEIKAMEKAIANASEHTGSIRIFQTIPRYQRRRAASYNVKRLPKYIRQRALAQLARDPDPPKAVTRKIKRIPARLSQFKTKQGLWLETHIWHAKRMKMAHMHSRKIALTPNQKSARSLHRASCHESVMHDASYSSIVEIRGPNGIICKALDLISDPTLPGFGAKQYLNGSKTGYMFLHQVLEYPSSAICPVTFLWKQNPQENDSVLWIWAPLGCLQKVYGVIQKALYHTISSNASEIVSDHVQIGPIQVKTITDMIKFEFTGPRSHAVLATCLKLTDNDSNAHRIWKDFSHLSTPASLPPGVVFSLTIHDPRILFPIFLTKRDAEIAPIDRSSDGFKAMMNWPTNLAESNLWDPIVREKTVKSRPSSAEINKRREKLDIPGSTLEIIDTDVSIPILLMKRWTPYNSLAEINNGWDLIAPKGWGMALWNLFSFTGTRVAGIQNQAEFRFEASIPSFPADFPESSLCISESREVELLKKAKYDRTPKEKRFNYTKTGFASPFRPDFESLFHESSLPHNGKQFNLLHSPKFIDIVHDLFEAEISSFEIFISRLAEKSRNLIKSRAYSTQLTKLNSDFFKVALVRVKLVLESGRIPANSKIHSATNFGSQLDAMVDDASLMGYTTTAGYSLSQGISSAIGSVSLKSLFELCKTGKDPTQIQVFVRGPTSRRSRKAKLTILF